jgi:hypothetical protein
MWVDYIALDGSLEWGIWMEDIVTHFIKVLTAASFASRTKKEGKSQLA